tara:strand:- start:2683 stop:3234 length:552 start_codon:yes stop_codon:yes gene_type:complete
MIRKIVFYPDPVLRSTGAEVTEVTDGIRELASDMLETMYDANGVGLAAHQVGESIQMAIVDVSHDEECVSYLRVNGEPKTLAEVCPITFLNPKLELIGEKDISNEGCLSFPDLTGDISRPFEVKATLTTLDGEELVIETDGLFARAIQHETDHLFGRLFVDRMSSAKKMAIKRVLKEMQQEYG